MTRPMRLWPLLCAVEKGYFVEQGLELQRERFQSGAVMTAPLGTARGGRRR